MAVRLYSRPTAPHVQVIGGRRVTWRAFIIGLLGVIGLNLLTPVNDYALGNTFLTGGSVAVWVCSLRVQ